MNKLDELELKYKELGVEIAKLKKPQDVYPIYAKHRPESEDRDMIVKFTGPNKGTLIVESKIGIYKINNISGWWVEHTDTDTWEILPVCPKTGFFHTQLVWCWEDKHTHARSLRFYDVNHRSVFSSGGKILPIFYNNYEAYEDTYPEWALEAMQTLKT